MMICPRKQDDDRTRVLRELKTKRSRDHVPITQKTATILRSHLKDGWKSNPQSLLFPNLRNRPWKRANVVKFGLHPILKKLGLPTRRAGLHAFRHGLGTALADAGVSPAVVQKTLRHTDIAKLLTRLEQETCIVPLRNSRTNRIIGVICPFCPLAFLLGLYQSGRWLVGAVGIEN